MCARKRPAIGAKIKLRAARVACRGEEPHHTAHGVGAIDGAVGSAHELEAVSLLRGDNAEVKRPAGIVHAHAIDDHFVVTGIATANEERAERATSPTAVDD